MSDGADGPRLSVAVTAEPGEDDDLELDHERFPFAGKFGRRRTGTAVAREDGAVVAALAFSPDRVEPSRCRIRYLAVRRDRQGEGVGPRFASRFVDVARSLGHDAVAMAADTPYAVAALERAGFGVTGETGPRGEVHLAWPDPGVEPVEAAYRRLLDRPGLSEDHREYCRSRLSR